MMVFREWFKFSLKQKKPQKQKISPSQWPDYIVTLEEKNFTEFITTYPITMVDFWAPWCAPCREMAPRFRQLSKTYTGTVAFGKIDIQNNQHIIKRYKISGIPHIILFHNGKPLTSITGVRSIGDLKDTIEAHLKKTKK
ncbi:MAG: thioredoxin family protein [Candidatus Thermoplasmatota archaeon]|nr:thioredoxin family protein [Candidatus Thermoplasmatota archaeon]